MRGARKGKGRVDAFIREVKRLMDVVVVEEFRT